MRTCTSRALAVTTATALVASSALVSCSKDEKSAATENLALPVAQNFSASTNLKAVTRDEVRQDIIDDRDFFDNQPEDDDAGQKCLKERMSASKIEASGSTLRIAASIDLTDCIKLGLASLGTVNKVEAVATFEISGTCEGEDLSAINGKAILEIASTDNPAKACSTAKVVTQKRLTIAKFALNFTAEGKTYEMASSTVSAFGTAELGVCTKRRDTDKQQVTLDEGCLSRTKTTTTSQKLDGVAGEEEGKVNLSIISFKNIVGTLADNPWFVSGKAEFDIIGWTGVVTYAGATTPPKFTIKKDGQETEHSFPAASSLASLGPAPAGAASIMAGWSQKLIEALPQP